MNKELLTFIRAIEKHTAQDFLKQAHPQTLSYDDTIVGPISIKHHQESEIMVLAEGFRQTLLSRTPGWAVTRIKMEYKSESGKGKAPLVPVLHKYGYIPGIVENVREIIGNLQKGVFRLPEGEEALPLSCAFFKDIHVSSHYKEFLLGQFFDEDQAGVIMNPEQKVLTFQDTGHHVYIKFKIEKGVGFKKAEDVKRDEMAETPGNPDVLTMILDANFTPVSKAGYRIQEETLQFEIETNGAISPFEAYEIAYALFSRECMQSEES